MSSHFFCFMKEIHLSVLLIWYLGFISQTNSAQFRDANGANEVSTGISLAIVFDSTGSMGNDLKQVKLGCRRILNNHLQKGYKKFIKDFVLVQVHDPDVGPAKKTTSPKTFSKYLDYVFTQGGGDCPEMTISGIEMALEASRPHSLIYVFTDSSAKDHDRTPKVLNLIQKKQSQVIFVLTGFCNTTEEIGFQVYRQIASISSGQIYILGKGDVKEFMKIIEKAMESLKVHILQEESNNVGSKTYSFPIDSHVSQFTIQVTNFNANESIKVLIRDPEGRELTESNGLIRLMKGVKTAYFASKENPAPGIWTLEVSTKTSNHSVRITGTSEVDFLPGFSTIPEPSNDKTSRQPIKGAKNYLMANVTGNYLPGSIDYLHIMSMNGSSLIQLLANQTDNQIYISRYPFDIPTDGHFYIKLSGKDSRGYEIQRYSRIAIISRDPLPVSVSCPAKLQVKRGFGVNVTCLIQSEVPYLVNWYKNDEKIIGAKTDNVQFKRSSNVTYEIDRANEVSQGVYGCEMIPVVPKQLLLKGDTRDQVTVTVLPPPPTVLVPKNSSIEPLKDGELECSVFSTSGNVVIKWFKENPKFEIKNSKRFRIEHSKTSPNALSSKLTILSATENDNGQYNCIAEHEGGVGEAYGFIKTHTLPAVTSDEKEIAFVDNDSISASCRALATPPPTFSWFLNGRELDASDSRVIITNDGVESRIKMSTLKPQDAGELICKAKNSAGEDESRIKLIFISMPKIVNLDLSKEIPMEGDQQNVRCIAQGVPPPKITWEFNGSPVTTDGNILINETFGTLDINRIEKNMKGQWACLATNLAGTTRKAFTLDIGYTPRIKEFNPNIEANYGENITLKCLVDSQPPARVKWFKGIPGGDVIPIALGDRYFINQDNSLLIRGLSMEDQTVYTCEAQNQHGKAQESVQIRISGIVAPKIAFTQSKQTVVEGTLKKVIVCLVLESRPPAAISWLKNNKEIDYSSRIMAKENTLIIKNVKAEDEGIYTCIAKNQVGTAKFDIELDVQNKPIIIGDFKTFIETSEGKKLVLQCLTKGDPKPKIEWRKGGRPLTMEPGSSVVISPDGSELNIYSVAEEHAGTFTCTATNDHAAVVKEFKVTVKTPPIISKEGISDYEIGSKDSVELNCVIISGNPSPKIEWFKNGQPITEIPGRLEIAGQKNILKVYGVNEDESGSYECKATNDVDSDSKYFQITVLVPPKASDSKLIKIYTKEGEKITLNCKIDGFPTPTKSWTWKSNIIDLQRNPFGIKSAPGDKSDLLITQMRSELQGIYTCEGVNVGGSAKMSYDVIILESPKIVQFKENPVFFIDNTITLTCIASGNPTPKIKWLFQKKLIPPTASGFKMVGENQETLIFERAAAMHGGVYSCLAENEGGRDQKDTKVTVFVPPAERTPNKNYTSNPIIVGGNITFTCVMNSTPPAEIKWFKNDNDIYMALPKNRFHISSDGSTLTLYDVKPLDEGRYKCLAVNIPGQWSLNFTLQVLISPVILPKLSSKPIININEETDLYISCRADGNPAPLYTWFKDNSQLVSGGRIEITDGGKTLTIKKVRRSDDAVYQCRVKNDAGEDKRNFDVNVFIPPTISGVSMRETPEFLKGSSANLWCNVTGFPTPNIKWSYLETSTPPVLLSNSTQMHFMIVDKSHITRYTCIATNEAGSARKLFDPILTYPPKIIPIDPEKKRWILKGGDMRLSCNSESAPQALTEWFKDGELIKTHQRINVTNRGTQLSLINAQEADIGTYKCLVSNKLGSDKQVWTVDIMIPPTIKFSSLPGVHQVALGGVLYLFCVAEGRPKPKIEWSKDGTRIDPRRVILSDDSYHLTINSTTESDVGRYQCTAENTHGQTDRSFDVQVTYGPTLDVGGKRYYKIERTVGGTTVLECLVSGNPSPTISWLKDGIPINRLPSYRYRIIGNGKQMEIIAMQASDAGRYSCVAKNTFGQMEIFMDVSVGAPPSIDRNRILNEYIVKVGDELRLPCPASGSPTPTITFSKDGSNFDFVDPLTNRDSTFKKRFTVSQERQMFTLYFAKRTDSGLYQCNASNPIGYDIMEYSVRVRTPPEFDTSNIQPEVYWFTNQTRSLECTLLGVADPPAKITWERHGSTLTSGGNIRISPDGSRVTIENVKQYDAGEYKCHAQNEVSKVTLTFQVLVYVKPRFYKNQLYTKIDAIQNSSVQMSCENTGFPVPVVTWYRQEREILLDKETYYNIDILRGNAVMQITNIQAADADLYACTASNGGGAIEKKFEISVILPPRIMKRVSSGVENRREKENVPVTFHCNVYNFNATRPVILWSKENSPILIGDMDYYLTTSDGQSLTILNPKSDESGRYTCEAKNLAGQDSYSFVLTITSPPKFPAGFLVYKEIIKVQLGSSVNFQCPAEGSPPPTIIWFHKDIPISPYDMVNYVLSNNAKVLTIPSVTKEGGVFHCMARNDVGILKKYYELEIIMPTLVRLDKVEVRERAGTTFSVLCTAEGHPKPILQWIRDGKGIFRLGTKTDSRTGLLEISDAKEEDTGRYTCTGTNKVSQDSKSVDVVIISAPKIEAPKKPIMVRMGEQVLLPCIVEGTRPIRVHWYTPNNNQISSTILGEYRFLPEQGLLIDRVRKDHAGVYRCVANNDAGYQEIRVTLDVLVQPKIFRPAETEITGIFNSVLQMQCKILEGMPPPTIVWERNGVTLSKIKNYYTTTESGLFIFNSLKNEDEGSLTCIAKNTAGEDRLTFQISVELLPKVSLPMSVTADEGRSVTITCRVEGKPKPSVTWKKEGQSLTSVLGNRFRLNAENEVYIYDIKPDDAGNYICIGERSGAEASTASTYLSVFTRPKFMHKPKSKMIIQETRWISFTCIANSHPKPDIKWMFNGRAIDSTTNSNGRGVLIRKSVKPEDEGEYKCIATNRAGSEEYKFNLEVVAKPKVRVYQSDEPRENFKRSILMCKVEGKVDSIIWLKNGVIVQNSSRLYISNSNLIIDHAESRDTGTYQCIASNTAGEAQGQVNFLVKSPPILTLMPSNTSVNLGDVLVLHCAADGYPVPVISWYKDKKKLDMDFVKSVIRNGSLRIIGVQKEHEGIYFCVATSNKGEVHSNPVYVSVQIAGGWSIWEEWSKCSVSCGKGYMTRKRLCNNPPPSNEGMACIGESEEKRNCLLRFCPTDGQWSTWQSWSVCSTTCGSGIRQRTRRCDNPPPSNLGMSCSGDALEDILCEGNSHCPVDGAWSEWNSWSVCSITCGSGGSQRRERSCNNPEPKNSGKFCPGKDLEIRSCSKGECPVDGNWSSWSKWSYCSKSCGSGMKQRIRRCDKPIPKFGGADCVGSNIMKTKCNEPPCPIHGQWSNWGSWTECSTKCGSGLQERDRTCSEPAPSTGGQWCRGPSKDVQRCNENKCDNVNNNIWSSWSQWSECSLACVENIDNPSVKTRTRKCLAANKICSDKGVETIKCDWIPKCSNLQSKFNSLGEIRGTINGEDIGVVLLNASWNSKDVKKTNFNIVLSEIKKRHLSCFKVYTGLLTPLLWHEAYEVGSAGNGKATSKGNFDMQTNMEFADGNKVDMNHKFFTENGQVKLLTTINGQCPSNLLNTGFDKISLDNYKEIIVQMNPVIGKLNADSSRLFRINKEIEPYQWSTNITVPKGKRQPLMVQQLVVQDLSATTNVSSDTIYFFVSSLIAEDDDSKSCPPGFNLIKGQKFCEDVNECADVTLNKCDQICENTVPRFKCNCRRGFSLGSDGKSCQDIDECSKEMSPCTDPDQECVNSLGSFICQSKCPPGLRRSKDRQVCEDINECVEKPNICGIQHCVNTYSNYYCLCRQGYQKVRNTCTDINECSIGVSNCKQHQKCKNTPGSFYCENVCNDGYQLINEQCFDIDECVTGIASCSSGATCTNLPGSFKCECEPGFHSLSGACVDLDECQLDSSICKYGCKNTYGSYECLCPQDLKQSADKKSCVEKQELCKHGFKWSADRGCIDIDECDPKIKPSVCQYNCINTYGSYQCSCPKGYTLYPRTMKCLDIDECRINRNICSEKMLCINTPGNYSCIDPNCRDGYVFDSRLRVCVLNCTDKSEKCLSKATRIQYVVVHMSGSMAQPVEVRVINTMKEKENNCQYERKDMSPNIPVTYESFNGSIILKPTWNNFNELIFQNQPYFILFDVACWSTPEKLYQIFQKSFYIYITVSKYPF